MNTFRAIAIFLTQLPLILFIGAKYDLVFGFQRIDSGFGLLLALFLLAPVFNVSWLVAEVIRTVKYARQPGRALRFSMPFVAIFFLIESIAINLYIASHARM